MRSRDPAALDPKVKFVDPAALDPKVKFPAVVAEFEDGDPPQSLVEFRRQSLLTSFCFDLTAPHSVLTAPDGRGGRMVKLRFEFRRQNKAVQPNWCCRSVFEVA